MYCVAILIILMVSALVFPIVFLLSLTPVIRQTIALVAFVIIVIAVEMTVFVQKIYRVVQGVKVGDNMSMMKREVTQSSSGTVEEQPALRIADAADLARRRPEEAVTICNDQIQKWQALLVRLQTAVDAELRSSSKSGVLAFTASMRVTSAPVAPRSHVESEGSKYNADRVQSVAVEEL